MISRVIIYLYIMNTSDQLFMFMFSLISASVLLGKDLCRASLSDVILLCS